MPNYIVYTAYTVIRKYLVRDAEDLLDAKHMVFHEDEYPDKVELMEEETDDWRIEDGYEDK